MSEKKPKILIVHNFYQIPGGEDTVVANEKRLLEEHGHEVLLYTQHNAQLKELSKIEKLLLPISTVFRLKTYREVKALIRREKIDVLHVHNTLNLISPSVYYAGFRCQIPVVQTVHNFRLLCPGATFFRDGQVCEECLVHGLGCAVRHKCYRNSRLQTFACVVSTWIHRMLGTYGRLYYICLTEFNKEKLLHLKQIRPERVFVKPNFVKQAETVVPISERRKRFIYVGRLEEIKGIRVLLKAWELLGEDAPELLLCGSGPLEAWCAKELKEKKLGTITMCGFLPNEKVRTLIGGSLALILPTQVYEGFPMTIAESYACGTPVLGSDLGNTGNLIIEGQSGWKFSPQSPQELAECVKKISKTPMELSEELKSRYTAEENYSQLRKIYETCCDHHEHSGTV